MRSARSRRAARKGLSIAVSAGASNRRTAMSVFGLKYPTPNRRCSSACTLTRLPGASAFAFASITISLEKIHGAPARARRPSRGFTWSVGRLGLLEPVSNPGADGLACAKRRFFRGKQMTENPAAKFASMRGKTPEEAKFFWTGGPVEVAPRTWFQSQFSGATAFETDEGLVLVDTGTKQFAPMLAQMLRQKTNAPVHTAIYTHGHIDHAYGLDAFLVPGQKRPRVIAHEAMPARFERYATTARHNAALNARQFGGTVEAQSQ